MMRGSAPDHESWGGAAHVARHREPAGSGIGETGDLLHAAEPDEQEHSQHRQGARHFASQRLASHDGTGCGQNEHTMVARAGMSPARYNRQEPDMGMRVTGGTDYSTYDPNNGNQPTPATSTGTSNIGAGETEDLKDLYKDAGDEHQEMPEEP